VLRLIAPLNQAGGGGSGAFPALASDGGRWWIKPLNNIQQSPMVPINEYVVGRIGMLITAPVCGVAIVEIPEEHAGWEFRPGARLEPGLASGSREVPDAHEERGNLMHRASDDNRRRHVGIHALWDLCFGQDPQWLHQATDDERIFSHDHGHYFPNGPTWSEQNLVDHVGEAHPWQEDPAGLDPAAIDEVAASLETITAESLAAPLSSVPPEWPIEDEPLEALGWFLQERASGVAGRLRSLNAAP
jgi:hypothetical protein